MKIAFFSNTSWYLFNFRLDLARALRAQGHDVIFLAPTDDYSKEIEGHGFRFISIPMNRRSVGIIDATRSIKTLVAVLWQEKPDILHNFTLKCVVYGTISARFTRVKGIVNAVTGLGYLFLERSKQVRVIRSALILTLKIFCRPQHARYILQNPDDLESIQSGLGIDKALCELIGGSGVDIERFAPANDNGNPKQVTVLFIGRLLKEKGIQEFVECADRVRKVNPNIVFQAAGDVDTGNPGSIDQKTIAHWRAEGAVEFLGHVDDMKQAIGTSTMVMLPSYGEGLPRSLLEAAASGKPLIAFDVPGCREIVIENENGFLLELGDVSGLADKVLELSNNPSLRRQMGTQSRRLVTELFSNEIVFKKTVLVYGSLLPKEGGRCRATSQSARV